MGIMRVERTPTPGPTLTPSLVSTDEMLPSHTPTPAPTITVKSVPPSETPTQSATPAPSETTPPTAAPTTIPLPTDVPPTPTPALAILSFAVDAEDAVTGKRFTFDWETMGASETVILAGTALRFPPAWSVAPSGTLTVELPHTLFPDPTITLIARDEQGEEVIEAITVTWPCQYTYFFASPASDCPRLGTCHCPLYDATYTSAAEQLFEGGRMLWLEEVHAGETVFEKVIFALYDDGRGEHFADTWTPDQPDSDPTLEPPEERFQPMRGFGKLWRENADVRARLGWALALEEGFEGAWQPEMVEVPPSVVFLKTLDDQTIKFSGWGSGSGSWRLVPETPGD